MKSQIRKIADSKFCYAIILNDHCKNSNLTRYSLYVEGKEGLICLWPNEMENLLPLQVCSHLKQYPCYHFTVDGYGTNHFGEIKRMLKRINPDIEAFCLTGYHPSTMGV